MYASYPRSIRSADLATKNLYNDLSIKNQSNRRSEEWDDRWDWFIAYDEFPDADFSPIVPDCSPAPFDSLRELGVYNTAEEGYLIYLSNKEADCHTLPV
jgi:hypothetical protein